MGQSESDLASVNSLSDSITALEAKLSSISTTVQDNEIWPTAKEGRILTVCGARLQCRSTVKILTGPIIGKTTHDQATILIEVDKDATITMFVSLIDDDVVNGRVITSVEKVCEARVPTTIKCSNLLPGESYIVSFSGVSRQCAETRIGQFTTLDLSLNTFRLLSVSCDNPSSVLSGEHNMWETISQRVLRKELPRVNCILHLGGQVCMRKAFEDSWVILQRHSERSDLMPGEWNRVEAEVLEKLRSAYRFQWNLPYSREVLASCSHLMICSDKDVYPNFTLDLDLSLDVGGRVVTTLLRLARRVYREYQRALWDTEDLEELNEKEEEMVKKVTEVFESRRRRLGREAALAKAEKAMIKLRSQPYTDEDVIEEAQDKIEEFRYEVNEAKSHEDSAASEVVTTSAKESSFHVFGDVGVMLIDTRWSRVNGDGSQSGGNDLLSGEQWNEFELLLTVSTVRALVVCVEYPVVQMDRENTIRDACGGEHNHTPFHECNSTWALNEGQQKKLLEMLFGWKKREKWRQVLILSGGLCYGLDTVIKIRNSNWKIRQLTTGPLTDRPSEIRLGRIGSVLEGYYEFKHDFLPHQRNYVEALISTEYEGDSKIEAQLVGQYFARVGCLCGPVIGKVTSKSAIILIEVDHEAPISCMVADVISGAVLRTTKLLPARQPYAFVFDGLESDRHYTVRFEGFVNADDRMGSFTTQKDYEQLFKSTEGRVNGDFKLNFIFMSGELKGGGGVGNSVLVKQSETEKEGGGGISEGREERRE